MAPTSCFNGQVHRLPDSPEAYGAMITPPKGAPAQSRSTDLLTWAYTWHYQNAETGVLVTGVHSCERMTLSWRYLGA
jgi:hypothetical protein